MTADGPDADGPDADALMVAYAATSPALADQVWIYRERVTDLPRRTTAAELEVLIVMAASALTG